MSAKKKKNAAGDASKITRFFQPISKQEYEEKNNPMTVEEPRKRKVAAGGTQWDENDPGTAEVRARVHQLSRQLPVLAPSIGSSWFAALEEHLGELWFLRLSEFVTKERAVRTVHPSMEQVWAWTTKTDIKDTKVVILGQDPYPTPGNAHGLCFSVLPGVPHPASLKNIFKELESDVVGFQRPQHGYLGGWAEQGVLLLNSVLTVRSGEANSHKGRGWEKLTDAVIQWISANCQGVVFLLWGGYAQKKAAKVDPVRHHVLKAAHPSPLSANRGGWFGCGHFSQCNQLLEQAGRPAIDWAKLPEP